MSEEKIPHSSFTMSQVKAAINGAIASTGPHKGKLKAKRPNGLAGAAWLGLMLEANPYKVSAFTLMCLSPEEEEMFALTSKIAKRIPHIAGADRDRAALESIGAW